MSRRHFQIDLGALMWLIAIFGACLVVFPAMLDRLEVLLPLCPVRVNEVRPATPSLNATMRPEQREEEELPP